MATILETCNQLDAFKYSLDHLEMVKESNELHLMDIYLSSYEFMHERGDALDVGIEFINSSEYLYEKTEISFWARLWDSIIRLIKKLIIPFKLIINAIKRLFSPEVEDTQEQILNRYHDMKPEDKSGYTGIAAKVPSDKYLEPIRVLIRAFKNKYPRLYKKILAGKYNNARFTEIYGKVKHKEGYKNLDYIFKHAFIGNEEETFVKNAYMASLIKQYEVPHLFAQFWKYRKYVESFIGKLKTILKKKRVVNFTYTEDDLYFFKQNMELFTDSDKTFLLNIKNVNELQVYIEAVLKDLEEIIKLSKDFVKEDNGRDISEDGRKKMLLFNDIFKDVLVKMNERIGPAIKTLGQSAFDILTTRELMLKLHPHFAKIVEELKSSETN